MKLAKTLALGIGLLLATLSSADEPRAIERGRYLVHIAGCNDCHTAGYAPSGGKIPEREWLKGDAVGFRGPWGTTYPSNLRLYFAAFSEAAFIADVRSGRMRPPMPWFNLAAMTDDDLRAIRIYARSLGEPGAPTPAYVTPDTEPNTPYIVFVPQPPKTKAASNK